MLDARRQPARHLAVQVGHQQQLVLAAGSELRLEGLGHALRRRDLEMPRVEGSSQAWV